jgi:polyhydroxybutyrate depolymerase
MKHSRTLPLRLSAIPRRALLAFGILAAAAARPFAQSHSMQFGGKARTYVLHAPSGLAANPPLMFVLCGHGMTGAQQQSSTKMDQVADREKFIVVYPDPISGNWDQSGDTDLKYYIALLDTLDAQYHIDRKRVYVAGFSQGAGMTHLVGCAYADKFAAIAPVSGNIPATCKPAQPIPMFLTFGTNDIATPDKFMASAKSWADLDGCPATPTRTRPYPATNANSVVARIAWGPCENGTQVVADSIVGGPHEWPMDTRTKVNNSEEVWSFFKQFTLGGTTSLPRAAAPASHAWSAVYAPGMVLLKGVASTVAVSVLDHRGRTVASGVASLGRFVWKDAPAGAYQVIVRTHEGRSVPLRVVVP